MTRSIPQRVPGILAVLLIAPLAPLATAQIVERVSVDSNELEANDSSSESAISADGRYVAFLSYATNLAPGVPSGGMQQVYVRDRLLGTTELASRDPSGAVGNQYAIAPVISGDGRFVAFASRSTNLTPGTNDTNLESDVFVFDRTTGLTELVSVTPAGDAGNEWSGNPFLSHDGRYVAFTTSATDIVPGSPGYSVVVRDRLAGTTELVSTSHGSTACGISADGNLVLYSVGFEIYVQDRTFAPSTELISAGLDGFPGNGRCWQASMSPDGRYVGFSSDSSNLVAGDGNWMRDVFLRDRATDTTELVSVTSGEAQANDYSDGPSVSADGRFVAFSTIAFNLAPGDTNESRDVMLRDRLHGTTRRIHLDAAGAQANSASHHPKISADGRWVAFPSVASNLVPWDIYAYTDVFVRDVEATTFMSLCDPGAGGVAACPCGNPPSGTTRGCDNSSATGGATLAASGLASLSGDSVVFTTSGEKPTALSIVLQGTMYLGAGLPYGQGVRCAGGALKRLYVKTASGGSIQAPEGADPSVSSQSAAKGDLILAGQSRYYVVYYRDPTVLGICPATSTFNATQTGQVLWAP